MFAISENKRMTIDAAVEAKGFRLTESTLNFAANVFDDQGKTMAIVNARFYPENAGTQEEAKQFGPREIKTIDADMRGAVDAPLKSMGQHMTRWYGSKMQVINGLHVYVHEHQVSRGPGTGLTRIRGMRVWASPRSFTVTLSYRERDATLLLPIINRMANSIQLD